MHQRQKEGVDELPVKFGQLPKGPGWVCVGSFFAGPDQVSPRRNRGAFYQEVRRKGNINVSLSQFRAVLCLQGTQVAFHRPPSAHVFFLLSFINNLAQQLHKALRTVKMLLVAKSCSLREESIGSPPLVMKGLYFKRPLEYKQFRTWNLFSQKPCYK